MRDLGFKRRATFLFSLLLAGAPGCFTQPKISIPVCESVDKNCACKIASWTICDSVCVDLMVDPAHCGSCGNSCPDVCVGGVCTSDCGSLTRCGNRCSDPATDPYNCGSCDNQCTGACKDGSCKSVPVNPGPTCTGGKVYCAGGCTDIASDVFNCGGCGQVCPSVLGICYREKDGSYWCCRGKLCNGKCTDVKDDPDNCGDCGIQCRNDCSFGDCR